MNESVQTWAVSWPIKYLTNKLQLASLSLLNMFALSRI
jgi:hypothetical protein